MNFTEEYAKRKAEIDAFVMQFTTELVTIPQPLHDAITYSLLNGGKRLRPILFLEAVRTFGGTVNASVINFALAIECIHTYSLIHDDLPCMDNDDFRRGQPTCHKKFGEANALLAGDALLNLAYELMFGGIRLENNQDLYIRAGSTIAAAAGVNGMVGGQTVDLASDISKSQLDYIYEKKTGALIRAALHAGALIGGATEEDLKKIDAFGNLFGYCFQLQDDLLDKDNEGEDKRTFLQMYGEEETRRVLKQKTIEALSVLQSPDGFFAELTANFMERKQ